VKLRPQSTLHAPQSAPLITFLVLTNCVNDNRPIPIIGRLSVHPYSQCLQRVIDKVKQWCDEWLLPLNVSKCNVMSFTSKINLYTSYCIRNKDSRHTIQKVDSIKDLGILFDTRLNFKDHIQEKINKGYNMIGLLKRNFIHVDGYTFILL